MEIVSMVLVGKVNKAGATAVGLSDTDSRLLLARPTPNSAKLGFVREVARVHPTVIEPLMSSGHMPVIVSIAADELGQSYNIKADTMAEEVAMALGAEKLILVTDVAGVLGDKEDSGSFGVDVVGCACVIELPELKVSFPHLGMELSIHRNFLEA